MGYQLRDRKNKAICVDSSGSSSDSDGDPDFSRSASRRMYQRNDELTIGNMSSVQRPGKGQGQGQGQEQGQGQGQGQGQDGASSSRGPVAVETAVKRRPGRPPRSATRPPVDFGEIPRRVRRKRSRTPYSLSKRTNTSGIEGERRGVLAWLLDTGTLNPYEIVYYRDDSLKRWALHGQLTRDGILCSCCQRVVSPSTFLAHAGSPSVGMMYSRIVVAKSKFTLLGYQLLAWIKPFANNEWKFINIYKGKDNGADMSDDACIICADGGDLICCDNCPLTFHQVCLGLKNFPENKWVCPCCLCKHCTRVGTQENAIAQCKVCEKSYHLYCSWGARATPSDDYAKFCGNACIQLYQKLESLMGAKRSMGEGFSWTLLRHSYTITKDNPGQAKFYRDVESNTKTALVWFMMNECFEPIIDRLTGINVLQGVVFNTRSKFPRLDFKGFYTIVLEKNDEVIAAASLRLRGKEMAEKPFVATQWSNRNQGMLRRLMFGVESALACLQVESLVLPSAEDVEDMWINKFGFRRMDRRFKKRIAVSKMLMFPKATRLIKPIVSTDGRSLDYGQGSRSGVEGNGGKTVLPFDLNLEPPPED